MKTEKIIPIALLSLIVGLVGISAFNVSSPISTDSRGTINYGSIVCVGATIDGKYTPVKVDTSTSPDGCGHNLLTNVGLNMIQFALNGTASTTTGVMLGNGTTVILPTDTNLPTLIIDSGLVNATGTYVYRGAGAWNVTKAFTSSGNSIGVNTTGLQDATTKLLLAEANFTTTTLNANDVINITWGLYITGTQ
jgi:hypothetical protein